MSLIVRPQNAASAARLATNALAGAAGMIAGGLYRKAQNKITDVVLNKANNLKNQLISSGTQMVTATAHTRRRRNRKSSAEVVPMSVQDTPPTALFSGAPKMTFGLSGRAQKNVEVGDNGVRITGGDVFSYSIASDGADGSLVFKPSAGAHVNVVYLDPTAVSARLNFFAQMYTYYAFRRLRFYYMPVVGTSTGGAISLAITSDLYSNQASNSLSKVLQNEHSTITEVWRPAILEIRHTGTKVFSPFTSNFPVVGERYQFEISGAFSSTLAAATYGVLFVEYEIDFYSPVFAHNGLALRTKATSVISPGPINESKIDSQPSDEKKEDSGKLTGWDNTVTGSFAANGTGANFVSPGVPLYIAAMNGSGENSFINGGYTLPSNGSGNNPAILPTLTQSCARSPLTTNRH
jgi:hypothetical protein